MQRDKVTILIVVVTVAAAIFAAEWYFFDYRPRAAEAALNGGYSGAPLPETSVLSGDGDVSAETYDSRDSEIIECEDPEVGKFYTNADSCEEADPPQSAKDDSQ